MAPKEVILAVFLSCLLCQSVSGYTTDFDLNELKVYAVGEGMLAPLNQWYFEAINDEGTCATSDFFGRESVHEANCKCKFAGDTCLDIFVASRAEKTWGIGAGSSWPDECADAYTVKEHFVNGKFIDSIYYALIECPPGFICRDGACVSRLNISLGASKNVVFDDDGTIISADLLTINGQELRDVRNLDLGDMVYNAGEFIYLGQEYRDARNISLNDSLVIADSLNFSGNVLANLTGLVLYSAAHVADAIGEGPWEEYGMLMQGIGGGGIIVHNPRDREAGFEIENPYDGNMVHVRLGAGESLVFWDDEGNITIRGSIDMAVLVGREGSFSVKGRNGALNVYRRGSVMHYELSGVTAYFDSRLFSESLETEGLSRAELSYQLGFICIDMSGGALYEYVHKDVEDASFGIHNRFMPLYRLCLAKKPKALFSSYDALFDLIGHKATIGKAISYLRPYSGFHPVYESKVSRNAVVTLDEHNVMADFVLGGQGQALVSSSHFSVLADDRLLLFINDNRTSDAVRSCKVADLEMIMTSQVFTLQGKGKLTAFGPLTAAQNRFEEELR